MTSTNLAILIFPLSISMRAGILVIALGLDAAIKGQNFIPHPIVIFGKMINLADRLSNKRNFSGIQRRINGIIAIFALVLCALIIGSGGMILASWFGFYAMIAIQLLAVTILLASRSLDEHVRPTIQALKEKSLPQARKIISQVVGRNPDALDANGIARAAIESTAENLSDGVIAPSLYYLVFGLPGLFAYKMINTADSMLGYRSSRYFAYGWGAARLDDIANLIPARLTAFLIAFSKPSRVFIALKATWREAKYHRSPNAGWSEVAMAASIGIQLGGAVTYGNRVAKNKILFEEGRKTATPQDIESALTIMWRAIAIFAILALGLALQF